MKYLKTLGVVAVVAAAFAAYVAGPASAAGITSEKTVLCKVNETKCAVTNQYPSGTAVAATLKSGTKAVLKAGFAVIECGESSIGGTAEWSEANHTPHGILTTETFTACNAGQTVTVNEKAELIIHHEEVEPARAGTGVLTVKGGKVTVKVGTVECTYGGTTGIANSGVMINGGAEATAVASNAETKLEKVAGGALCASPAEWAAEYNITAPKPLWIATTP
jgi:hypothetical protein